MKANNPHPAVIQKGRALVRSAFFFGTRLNRLFRIVVMAALIFPAAAAADTIVLKNGRRVDTQGTWEENGRIKYFKDGVIAPGIPQSDVLRIETDSGQEAGSGSPEPAKPAAPDLAARLKKRFSPKNAIEAAGQATVSIHTAAGSGSGFFITPSGHILTCRHVLQGDPKELAAVEQQLETAEDRLDQVKKALTAENRRIQKMADQIRTDRRYNIPHNRAVLREAKQRYRSRYESYEKQRTLLSEKQSDYRRLKTRLLVQKTIRITLMDRTDLTASIEKVSSDMDLALLRLEGYKTPFIRPGQARLLAQGERLYAIGNPLNFSHSVSAGVFSGHQRGLIMTSAPINAGNSGGPLVTSEGEVIGINTLKMVGKGVEGIGFAIPVQAALQEFRNSIQPHLQ